MTGTNDNGKRDLDAQIEHLTIKLRKDQLLARRHLRKAKESLHGTVETSGALFGAVGLGFLLERLLRPRRAKGKDDRQHGEDRRSRSGGGLLSFRNIVTVATTSLALLQKLDNKKVEAQKEQAEAKMERVKTQAARVNPDAQAPLQVNSEEEGNSRAYH